MALLPAESVRSAATRIAPYIKPTRLIHSQRLSDIAGVEVRLKLENEQRTGSFKIRGASNVIASLSREEREQGVVASSAGNHGLGVAAAAADFGVAATIFIPRTAPRVKRDGIIAFGATVIDDQPHYDAAMDAAKEFAAREGCRFINPCMGDDLIAGQGTVALEVLRDWPSVHTFILAVGGGGLAGGCGSVLREAAPSVEIVGAQSVNTAAMARSVAANRLVEIENLPTIAEGLAGQIDEDGLQIGREALDRIVTVSEADIGRAMLWLQDEHAMRVEGAGAAGVAAILSGAFRPRGATAIVISGGNVDDDRLQKLRNAAP